MSVYKCILYDIDGNRKKMKLNFDSEKELNLYAMENKFKIVNIKLIKEKRNDKLKDKELSIMCNQLGMLISSGCEITSSLNTIQSNCNKKLKSILKNINYNLQKGNSISMSFRNSATFSKFFINMIKAGEVSGKLDEILIDLSDYYKKEYEFKRKLLAAMIYPISLVVTCICVILFMLIYAVPNFQQSFMGNETNLPISTKALIEVSIFIRNYYGLIIILLIAIFSFIFYVLRKEEKFKIYFDKKLFNIKFIKNIIQTIEVNKFIRCLYILTSSGVQIVNALDISCNVIKNKYMFKKLYISKSLIQKGKSISESLKASKVFPKIIISMIEVGEETGKIEKCLYSININYDNDLDNLINKIVKSIEPVIIVALGLIIGVILVSIMIPVFDAITSFK